MTVLIEDVQVGEMYVIPEGRKAKIWNEVMQMERAYSFLDTGAIFMVVEKQQAIGDHPTIFTLLFEEKIVKHAMASHYDQVVFEKAQKNDD